MVEALCSLKNDIKILDMSAKDYGCTYQNAKGYFALDLSALLKLHS